MMASYGVDNNGLWCAFLEKSVGMSVFQMIKFGLKIFEILQKNLP